jgi:hypothetical protein
LKISGKTGFKQQTTQRKLLPEIGLKKNKYRVYNERGDKPMRFNLLRTILMALAFLAWTVPFIATPVHLHMAHSYLGDCSCCCATRGAELRIQCLCLVCRNASDQNTITFLNRPTGKEYEPLRASEQCSTCQILLSQNKICTEKVVPDSGWRFLWNCILTAHPYSGSTFHTIYCGRAPPFPLA